MKKVWKNDNAVLYVRFTLVRLYLAMDLKFFFPVLALF